MQGSEIIKRVEKGRQASAKQEDMETRSEVRIDEIKNGNGSVEREGEQQCERERMRKKDGDREQEE